MVRVSLDCCRRACNVRMFAAAESRAACQFRGIDFRDQLARLHRRPFVHQQLLQTPLRPAG